MTVYSSRKKGGPPSINPNCHASEGVNAREQLGVKEGESRQALIAHTSSQKHPNAP